MPPPGACPRLLALFGLRGEDVAEATEVLLFKESDLGGPGSLPGAAYMTSFIGELCGLPPKGGCGPGGTIRSSKRTFCLFCISV